jgi:hypothetical protein
MKYSLLQYIGLVGAGFSGTAAESQTYVDVNESISQALANYGEVPVTTPYDVDIPYEECHSVGREHERDVCATRHRHETRTRTENAVLSASNISISYSNIPRLEEIVYRSFPNDLVESSRNIINCLPYSVTSNVNLTLTSGRSHSVNITKSVSRATSDSFGFSATIYGVGVNARVGVTQNSTSGTATSSGETETISVSGSGTLVLPAHSRAIATLRAYRVQAALPFTVTAVANADLSPNDRQLLHLADALPESARTFEVKGEILSNNVSNGEMLFFDAPLEAGMCQPGVSQTQTEFVPTTGQRLTVSRMRARRVQIR